MVEIVVEMAGDGQTSGVEHLAVSAGVETVAVAVVDGWCMGGVWVVGGWWTKGGWHRGPVRLVGGFDATYRRSTHNHAGWPVGCPVPSFVPVRRGCSRGGREGEVRCAQSGPTCHTGYSRLNRL